ncbi:hypothetical protein JCM3765_005844 [Sporobolomyces pararoseus]
MPRQYIPEPVPEPWSPELPPPPKNMWEKFSRKFKEEPLVPIGSLATVVALVAASSALQKGNRAQFNKMLRLRVAAQGFTVIAALGGSVYFGSQRRAAREAEQRAKLAAAEASTPTPPVQLISLESQPVSSPTCAVALIGCGLVGKAVVEQLSSPTLSKVFSIVSLSNSKHTVSISPSASSLDAATLLSLLPPSSQPLPTSSSHPAATYSPANPQEVVKALATESRSTKQHTILIDCTSDLSVTELYPLAISSGLSVVTPNKKGFSSNVELWKSIVEAQSAPGAGSVFLEATVGAGLPIISTLRDMLKTGDEVTKIEGVFSGTFSYIFNNFSKPGGGGPKFSEVVKIAKENGYTEPHPADDLNGSDVARKLTILSRLLSLQPSSLPALPDLPEGYASLSTESLIPSALASIASGDEFVAKLPEYDAEFDKLRSEAEKEGMVLRYVGLIDRKTSTVKCALQKYPASHAFASALSGSDNIVSFHSKRYPSPLTVQGSGAGADVTAAGVVGDAIKVAERYGVRIPL